MVARSFKLPPTVDTLLDAVADKMGLNKTAALIVAINNLAKVEGVTVRAKEGNDHDD